jgi:hypothetical protein
LRARIVADPRYRRRMFGQYEAPKFDLDTDPPVSGERWRRPLYWLAGARWEALQHCPATERERIAVLGSTVLIPTIMSFLGMIFYAKSRFADPPWGSVIAISVAWAFVIMNTDRILLATYRPFQSFWRRCMQVAFRFGLAGVVSVAIGFPFCLDQYRPAITHRIQTELQGKLNNLRTEEAEKRQALRAAREKINADETAARQKIVADFTTAREALTAQLPDLQKAILNPETYADERMVEERVKASAPDFVAPASGATRTIIAQLEALKESLTKTQAEITEKQDLHRRLVEAIAREALGEPNEFYPEKKQAGSGPRLKDMKARDNGVTAELRALEGVAKTQQSALLTGDKDLSNARLADRNTWLDGLVTKRESFVEEGREKERIRKERLARVEAEIAALEADHPKQLEKLAEQTAGLRADHLAAFKQHEERYLPHITRLERKMLGVLDPMEETLGLYRVIFLPSPDADDAERAEQGYKWIAGLFQFAVIFGTLFVLDLVPIMAKIFSRPGPYDVLVEHPEFIAHENLRAFHAKYGEHANEWADTGMATNPEARQLTRGHPRRSAIARSDVSSEPRG